MAKQDQTQGNGSGLNNPPRSQERKAKAISIITRKSIVAGISLGIIATGIVVAPQGALQPFKGHHKPSPPPTTQQLKAYAKAKYGKDDIQFEALDLLLTMESHWNWRSTGAKTTNGRAYGIPQALPASKMRVAGADYLTNPYTQINWALLYLKSRYQNNAMYALKHELKHGWW